MSTYGNRPFGLRDVKVTNILGTLQKDLPAAQQMTFTPTFTNATLEGDDVVESVIAYVKSYEWTLNAGGIDLDALAIMTGETVTVAGSSPNETSTVKVSAGDRMPYFKIYGKSLGENASDDIHAKLYKCKITSMQGQLQGDQFYITQCSGTAIDDGTNGIIQIVQNETAAALPAS
jgi:hypothetical protein